jgi:hypothetical protein
MPLEARRADGSFLPSLINRFISIFCDALASSAMAKKRQRRAFFQPKVMSKLAKANELV